MAGIKEKIILWFNNQNIHKKLRGLYIFCVLVPLVVTDSVILYSLVGRERTEQQYKMEGQASAVQYNLLGMLENSFILSKNFYMNDYVHSFLDEEYKTPMDYIVSYQDFIEKTLFESSIDWYWVYATGRLHNGSLFPWLLLIISVLAAGSAYCVFPMLARFHMTTKEAIRGAVMFTVIKLPRVVLILFLAVIPYFIGAWYIEWFLAIWFFITGVALYYNSRMFVKEFKKLEGEEVPEDVMEEAE